MTVTVCDKCGCKAIEHLKLGSLWLDLCNDCLPIVHDAIRKVVPVR